MPVSRDTPERRDVTDEFTVSDGLRRLTLAGGQPHEWTATLQSEGLCAGALVENGPVNLTGLTIADLFAELSESWRGWDGERVWSSNEGTLELTAAHDGVGHITLRVVLRHVSAAPWEIGATLILEAGALAALAREAARFDRAQAEVDGRSPNRTVRREYLRGWDAEGRPLP